MQSLNLNYVLYLYFSTVSIWSTKGKSIHETRSGGSEYNLLPKAIENNALQSTREYPSPCPILPFIFQGLFAVDGMGKFFDRYKWIKLIEKN